MVCFVEFSETFVKFCIIYKTLFGKMLISYRNVIHSAVTKVDFFADKDWDQFGVKYNNGGKKTKNPTQCNKIQHTMACACTTILKHIGVLEEHTAHHQKL